MPVFDSVPRMVYGFDSCAGMCVSKRCLYSCAFMFAGIQRASKIMKGIESYAIASLLILDIFCTKSVPLLVIVANYNSLFVFFFVIDE